jgi:hypothetical protein
MGRLEAAINFESTFTPLDAVEYYKGLTITPEVIEKWDSIPRDRGSFANWLYKLDKEAHDIIKQKDKLSTCVEWFNFYNQVTQYDDSFIRISRDENEFCTANHDDDGHNFISSCHSYNSEYHFSPHALSSIENYYVAKIMFPWSVSNSNMFRFYFYHEEDYNAIYHCGGYASLGRIDIGNQNGHQKLINIMLSKIVFETLETRAMSNDVSVWIENFEDDNYTYTYYNENNSHKQYMLFVGDEIPPKDICLEIDHHIDACGCSGISQRQECHECGERMHSDDSYYIESEGENCCEDCTCYCENCDERVLESNYDGEWDMCNDCTDHHTTICYYCETRIENDDVHEHDSNDCCQDCFEEKEAEDEKEEDD